MSSVYLNSPPSPFPFIQLKEDNQQMHFSTTPQNQASSSLSYPISFNITQDQASDHHSIEPQKDINDQYTLQNRSSDHRLQQASSIHPTVENAKDMKIGALSICKVEGEVGDKRDYESANWTSKTMNAGSENKEKIIKIKIRNIQKKDIHCETTSPANSNNSNIIRICSDCKTTKTPLWRSGPQGPKSLCNACGIRQRKARRAMLTAAAAADANETVLPTVNSTRTYKVQKKEKKSRTSYHMASYKKPFGPPDQWGGRISFEDFAMSLSKSLACRRTFPKDDQEEAAILLMALSCGLLHS